MATPTAPKTHSFKDHMAHHSKGVAAPKVAGAPTVDNVMSEFTVAGPASHLDESYAGEHSATMASGGTLHTRHGATKTQAATHEALTKKDITAEFHATDPAYQVKDFDPSKLTGADKTKYETGLKAAQDTHAANVEASKQALSKAGIEAHSHVDLTQKALNQRMEVASSAKTSALAQVEAGLKDGTLKEDAAKTLRETIEAEFKAESAKINAAGKVLDAGRKEVATASGVASKWEGAAATQLGKVEKEATGIMGKLGGVKSGIVANWNASEKVLFNKGKVVVGGLMMADGARRAISDIASMAGGQKGVDKNGEPLPQPGIMNIVFDAGELIAGTAIAATKMGRGH